jgi:hypothetical protein
LVAVMAPSRPKRGPPVKRAAEEGWLMRYLSAIVAPLGISATLLVGQAVAQVESPAPPECPIKTAVENTVIARAWHEDVINRRNPAILQDILASDVVHHGNLDWNQYLSHQVRTNRGGLVGGRCRESKAAAHGRYLG